MPELKEDQQPLTADEILTFGPLTESAVVWTPSWIQESRAPIAQAAGRPRLKRVFDDDGVGKAVVIRPCMSRGKRIRGLPPIYTPQMLEANAGVFSNWPMYWDHVPAKLGKTLQAAGRSAKDLSGQVLRSAWRNDFTHADDAAYGYRVGGVLAEIWATPLVRTTVDNNPNLLHTSINAWPKSGRPGPCPWKPDAKGMLIEGIRRMPQGSLDLVPRGGAGGRLLAEGEEWPEVGWTDEDERVVVSLAESFYASAVPLEELRKELRNLSPEQLREWVQENASHLLPALAEADSNDDDADDQPPKRRRKPKPPADDAATEGVLTAADAQSLIEEALVGERQRQDATAERLEERARELVNEREQQRALADHAAALIESAEGIPPSWKRDLKARYAMTSDGPPETLLVEADVDSDGNELSEAQVLERQVKADLDHVRDLIAEARGRQRPRVTGEGGAPAQEGNLSPRRRRGGDVPLWRQRFAEMRLVESADDAVDALYGDKVDDGEGKAA